MVYSPQYYPGSSHVGINHRRKISQNLEGLRIVDIPARDGMQRLIDLTARTTAPIHGSSKKKIGSKGFRTPRKSSKHQKFRETGDMLVVSEIGDMHVEKSKEEIRNEKIVRRAESEQRRLKGGKWK